MLTRLSFDQIGNAFRNQDARSSLGVWHGSHCRRCRSGAAIGAAGGRQDASGSGDRAQVILAGYTVLFVAAPTLVAQLAKAHSEGRLDDRLTHFGKPKLPIHYAAGFPPISAWAARQPETLADEQRLRLASR